MYGEIHLLWNAGLRVFLWIYPCNQACTARKSFGEKSWYVRGAVALIIFSNKSLRIYNSCKNTTENVVLLSWSCFLVSLLFENSKTPSWWAALYLLVQQKAGESILSHRLFFICAAIQNNETSNLWGILFKITASWKWVSVGNCFLFQVLWCEIRQRY